MILELLTLASLLRLDPAGDAYGAGDLVPPSAEVYADLSSFDLLGVEVADEDGWVVRVRLAGIPDPGGLPNGLTLPVVDVYVDLAEGGEEAALPGVGMAFPEGHGWEVAIRLHGDRAFLVRATDPARRERPVEVTRAGDVLTIATGLSAPEEVRDLQAVTGVYDPFSANGWRPLSPTASPWAFASETPAPPVVDLLAEDDDGQRRAIRGYLLPPTRDPRGPVGWLLAMFAGLGLAAAGLWLRRHVAVPDAGAEPDAEEAIAVPEDGTLADRDGVAEDALDGEPSVALAETADEVPAVAEDAFLAPGELLDDDEDEGGPSDEDEAGPSDEGEGGPSDEDDGRTPPNEGTGRPPPT